MLYEAGWNIDCRTWWGQYYYHDCTVSLETVMMKMTLKDFSLDDCFVFERFSICYLHSLVKPEIKEKVFSISLCYRLRERFFQNWVKSLMCGLYVGKHGTAVKLTVSLYLLAFHIVLEFSLIQFVDEIILCTRKQIISFW